MIIIGVALLLLTYLLALPPILNTIGIILVVLGAALWVAGAVGHPVGGRQYWY